MAGERASDDTFKPLDLDAPGGPATVGTTFTSSGAASNGTFHDRSVVGEASRPTTFVIETDARLDRTRGEPWDRTLFRPLVNRADRKQLRNLAPLAEERARGA